MHDRTAKHLSTVHSFLFRATGGRLGKRLPGVQGPMLLLTTRGARSGSRHTVPLLYIAVDGAYVVIASWGGRDYPPDWYVNLLGDSSVTVQIDDSMVDVVARVATAGERERLWPLALKAYPGYDEYQSRTTRIIPMVWLTPTPPVRPSGADPA